MNLPNKVTLREVVSRDGFQSLDTFIPTRTKIEVIKKTLDAGIKEIELTSFVSHKSVYQLSDASDLMLLLPEVRKKDIVYGALVANLEGAEDAIAAGVDRLIIVTSASESHNRANIRRSVKQSLSELVYIFELAKRNCISIIGSIAVAFGCPYEGNVNISEVLRIAETYLSLGAVSVILADTIGIATPRCIETVLSCFKKQFSEKFLTLHFHNNRGTAMANLLASMYSGVTSFDTALGGIGGCPNVPLAAGNLPTEDVVCMLERMNIKTDISIDKIIGAAHLLERVLGYQLPGQSMKNKFCTI